MKVALQREETYVYRVEMLSAERIALIAALRNGADCIVMTPPQKDAVNNLLIGMGVTGL